MSWTTIKDIDSSLISEDVSEEGSLLQGHGDKNLERRVAEMRHNYESAMKAVGESADAALAFFSFISDAIRTDAQGLSSPELSQLRYLSLKNRSQLLEEKGEYADALEYALEAQGMEDSSEPHLLFRICTLSIKLGDPWTPKMLLAHCNDFKNTGLMPVVVTKLHFDIDRLERSKFCCVRENGLDVTPSAFQDANDDFNDSVLHSKIVLDDHFPDAVMTPETSNLKAKMILNGSGRANYTSPALPLKSLDIRSVKVGDCLSIYWKDDQTWFDCVVLEYFPAWRVHKVEYLDDKMIEELFLPRETFKLRPSHVEQISFFSEEQELAGAKKIDILDHGTQVEEVMEDAFAPVIGVDTQPATVESDMEDLRLMEPTNGVQSDSNTVEKESPQHLSSDLLENSTIEFECLVTKCNRRRFLSRGNFNIHMRSHWGEDIEGPYPQQLHFPIKCIFNTNSIKSSY